NDDSAAVRSPAPLTFPRRNKRSELPVASRERFGHELSGDRYEGGRRQGEVSVGLTGAGDDVHAESPRHAHDRLVFRQEVHEEPRYAAIARVRHSAFEQRTSNAVATVLRQNREPKLGSVVSKGDMRRGDEREPIIVDPEDCIAAEDESLGAVDE